MGLTFLAHFKVCAPMDLSPWAAVHIYHADNINAWTLLLLRFTLFFLTVQATLIESEQCNWIHKAHSPAVLMSAWRPATLARTSTPAQIHIQEQEQIYNFIVLSWRDENVMYNFDVVKSCSLKVPWNLTIFNSVTKHFETIMFCQLNHFTQYLVICIFAVKGFYSFYLILDSKPANSWFQTLNMGSKNEKPSWRLHTNSWFISQFLKNCGCFWTLCVGFWVFMGSGMISELRPVHIKTISIPEPATIPQWALPKPRYIWTTAVWFWKNYLSNKSSI